MIGGTDIVIAVKDEVNALSVALSAIARMWGSAVFEDADTGRVAGDFRELAAAGGREVLAYRDAEARAAWDELGADPKLNGTLIHLIARKGELTLGVDDVPGVEMREYVERLRQALRPALFEGRAKAAG